MTTPRYISVQSIEDDTEAYVVDTDGIDWETETATIIAMTKTASSGASFNARLVANRMNAGL